MPTKQLKQEVGDCVSTGPIVATGALSGDFAWTCATGRVTGSVDLAPTQPPRVQSIEIKRANDADS